MIASVPAYTDIHTPLFPSAWCSHFQHLVPYTHSVTVTQYVIHVVANRRILIKLSSTIHKCVVVEIVIQAGENIRTCTLTYTTAIKNKRKT